MCIGAIAHCTVISVPPKGDGDGGCEGDGVCVLPSDMSLYRRIWRGGLEGGGEEEGSRVMMC